MKPGRCPIVPSRRAAARRGPACARGGVALVLVLTFLVLIAALIVAFFTTVTTELAGSKSYASGVTARQLADSAVHIAMGTVGQATAATKPGDATSPLIWASQPGMIRTYDNTGAPFAYYKLYSSDSTVVDTFPFQASDYNATWNTQPARYTDLNAPAIVNGSATRYPIVDPRASVDYPMTGANTNGVKGFSISGAPTDATATTPNPVPMPVKWIYVLNDGTMTTPTSVDGTGKIASWSGSTNAPTAANPIVGRVAYWADDDTCKVNINTAAGDVWTNSASFPAAGVAGNPGSFWDAPRTSATFERTYLGQNQPAQHEFQRYPGHPATTYLSTVFPTLTTDALYQIAPRVVKGGSLSGTQATSSGSAALTPDSDRLYASVDELLFTTTRTDSTKRDPNPLIADATLSPTRFFLTARSRAPEINLFNQPRIATWPVYASADPNNDPTHRTPFDSLIAFCATLNNNAGSTPYPYYFQRTTAASQTVDLPATATAGGLGRNRSLITYLRNLTSKAIPGFGGSFLTKYPKDRDQILTEIFDYIRALNAQDVSMRATVPLFASYTPVLADLNAHGGVSGEGQILPIIDTSHADGNAKTLRGFGRFPTVREASIILVGVGQTVGTKTSVVTGQPAIADGKTRVKAVFDLNFFDPSQGFAISIPDFYVRISGLNNFTVGGINMGYASPLTTIHVNRIANGGAYGGYIGASTLLAAGISSSVTGISPLVGTGNMDLPTNSPNGVPFSGGTVTVEIMDGSSNVLQTLAIPFLPNQTLPVPLLAPLLQDPSPALNSDYRVLTAAAPGTGVPAGRFYGGCGTNTGWSTTSKNWVCGKDVIRSVEANTDYRTIAALASVDGSYFTPMADYAGTANLVHSISDSENGAGLYPSYNNSAGSVSALVPGATYGLLSAASITDLTYTGFVTQTDGTPGLQPTAGPPAGGRTGGLVPAIFGQSGQYSVPANGVSSGTNLTGTAAASYPPGDWDTGFSIVADGPFINKADEGTNTGNPPYYQNLAVYESVGSGLFSPNRMMPSAGMFGSLPTGVFSNRPWQTLLFRPDPGGTPQHLGAQSPPDYLLLDLFNMPVVEPYPISDPFSTAGKINMNYQIVPFTYVTRTTGIRAVLKAEQPLAIPTTDSNTYKSQSANYANHRLPLDIDLTLTGFQTRFSANDIFRSASEICSLWLVPQGASSYATMQSYWSDKLLTGDNVRERPYTDIYPRLTTQSNTYTVHYRVQSLKTLPNSTAGTWTEGKDAISSEYRGASTFERYLDTGDTTIPDYATAANPKTIDNFYKFRIIETKQFTP